MTMTDTERALAQVTRERARTLGPAVFLVLAVYIASFRSLGIAPPRQEYVLDVVVVGALGALSWAMLTRRIPLRWAHAASTAVLWCPLAVILSSFWATGDHLYATLYVMTIGSAGVLLATRWLASTLVVADAIAVALLVDGGGPYSAVLISCVITASLFALLVHALMRRALVNVERSQASFRALVETSPDAMFIHGEASDSYAIGWVNESMLRLLGYQNADELLGKRSTETFVHPDERVRLAEHRQRVHRGEVASGIDVRWVRRDGATRHVHASSRAVSFAGRKAWLVVARDMTEQLERERERAAATAVSRRLEEQLHHSQRMDAIGQLAGGVAHDFNNILAVILSNASLVAEELGPEHPLRPEILDIEAATERAAGLTRQLLAFSRKQPRRVTDVALNSLVTNLEKMLSRIVSEDIQMSASLAPTLGTVQADVTQLEQVLLNLVVNARDAMPAGGRLAIETANVELDEIRAAELGVRAGRHVMLAVSDTGCGMSDETRARIFEPFFTTKPVGKGTGLGLATVFGIVKQTEGGIAVESAAGRGSTFRIYLPRVDVAPAVTPIETVREAPRLGAETVLVVEDDPLLRTVLRRQLQSFGYRLLEASSPEQALEVSAGFDGHIDLLLTDLVMPGMDGRMLATKLVAMRPTTRVLYMSGYSEHAAVTSAALDPRDRLLEKPFTAIALSHAIRETLEQKRAA